MVHTSDDQEKPHLQKIFRKYWQLLLIVCIAAFLFLFRLNRDLLWDWDECVYAQWAMEMKSSHAFLVNVWNGYTDLQKPPLYTWMLQIPLLFGTSEFQFRILSVFCSLGLITATYLYAARYLDQRTAIFSAFFLLASESILVYTTRANTDIFLTLFVFLAFCCWSLSRDKPGFSYISGICLALGNLVKGLTPLLYLFAIFVSVALLYRKEKAIRFGKLFFTFLLVALPWHLLVYHRYGQEFLSNYIVENIFKRSTEAIDFHQAPWYVYLLQFYREFFPWIFLGFVFPTFALFGDPGPLRTKIRTFFREQETWLEILFFLVIPFSAITLMKTRVAWYALPIYPYFALYLAGSAAKLLRSLKLQKGYFLLLIPVILDATLLLIRGNGILNSRREIPPRYETILAASRFPEGELHYLIPKDFRDAHKFLPPEQQIPPTWIYGGNPCAVYYGKKDVHFYYAVDEFRTRVQAGKGLFMIENSDKKLIENLPVRTVFHNEQYSLLER